MEEDRESTRYWCHQCNLEVDPILEIESVNCSLCHGGFIEEMGPSENGEPDPDRDPDHALSLWAPILLAMLNNPRRRRRFRQLEFSGDNEEDDDRQVAGERHRRRSSSAMLRLLQGVRAGTISESENNTDTENQRERVILINPFNQTIIVQGGNTAQTYPIGSLGDYFSGPGLELLLQHLAENDPNRYGTAPAKKEAVESMPTVITEEPSVQCSVCLDDFEVGTKVKEMPCKHRFHDKCIVPWLELHSSCPVCRFELPCDESKLGQGQERDGSSGLESVGNGEDGRNVRRFSVSLPWPFNGLFSSTSGSQTGSLMTSTSGSGNGSSPRAHEPRDREDNR